MSIINLLLKSGSSLAKQGIARVLPTGEERVIRGLRAYGERFFDPANAQGLTVDPRTGQNIVPTEAIGNMMSRIPNPPNNANVVSNVDDLVKYVQSNPAVMRELRTGGYAGGWFDPAAGGLVFDPSRRYLTRGGAMRAGRESGQKAGFDLSTAQEFPVRQVVPRTLPEPIIGQASGSILGALGGGTSSAAALGQDGELSGTDLLGVLGGAAAGALAGRAYGGRAASDRARGMIAPAQLRKMRELGVQESAEGGIQQAGLVAKNRARSIGVPEEMLSDIKDGEREVTAFRKAYDAAYKHLGGAFGARTKKELPALQEAVRTAPKAAAPPAAGVPLANRLVSTFTKAKRPKNATDTYDSIADVEITSQVSEPFQGLLTPVRHAANHKDLAKLARSGQVNRLAEAVEDIQNNFASLVTVDDIAAIQARNGSPVFYILHNLATRARAAALGMPVTRLLGAQGAASAMAGPITEVQRALAATKLKQLDKLKDLGSLRYASSDFSEAGKQARKAGVQAGDLIGTGKQVRAPLKAMETIEDDVIKFMKDPTSVPGIREKVWTYLGTIGSPYQKVVSTMDSWMMRAGFGNDKLSTASNTLEYQLMHEALNDLAARYGVPPAALQEVIWKNIRVLRGETGDAFTELFPKRFMYPNVSTSAKSMQPNMPSVIDVAKSPESRKANKQFVSKLIRTIKEDPSIANYIEIVGEDIEFTDEFFKAINLF